MSCPVKSLPDDSKLVEAVDMMIDKKISAVVVMNGDDVAGIITHEDLLRLLADMLRGPATFREKLYLVGDGPTLNRVMQLLSGAGI